MSSVADSTAADVNGDGLTDLLYGVRYADANGRNSGSLMIHLGQPEGGFGEAPSMILNGPIETSNSASA